MNNTSWIKNIEVFKKPNYEIEYQKSKVGIENKLAQLSTLQKCNTVMKAKEVIKKMLDDETIKYEVRG